MAAVLAAGRLDRRITLQGFYESQDATGEPIKTWRDLPQTPTVWAQVTPVALTRSSGGQEFQAADQLVAVADTRFRVRYRRDLSVEHRIVYDGEHYEIASISEIGRREGLEIIARKAVS
jgi:SPP1 family predicted phage head-tail adaptor